MGAEFSSDDATDTHARSHDGVRDTFGLPPKVIDQSYCNVIRTACYAILPYPKVIGDQCRTAPHRRCKR